MMALFFARQPAEAPGGRRAGAWRSTRTTRSCSASSGPGWARRAPGSAAPSCSSRRSPATRAIPATTAACWRVYAYMQRDYRRAESLIRQAALEKFPLYHFVAAVIYAQLGKGVGGCRGP